MTLKTTMFLMASFVFALPACAVAPLESADLETANAAENEGATDEVEALSSEKPPLAPAAIHEDSSTGYSCYGGSAPNPGPPGGPCSAGGCSNAQIRDAIDPCGGTVNCCDISGGTITATCGNGTVCQADAPLLD